jgi:prepilin-type processing-associated H-X9-DG protein/prepilin-type N-terminal cleavage/methylation domain-containing protein
MHDRPDARPAFTLVELLLCVSVIALLVGIILPAIQSARETSFRARCQNNLRQLGLAAHTYHDLHGVLPKGHRQFAGTSPDPMYASGWLLSLLPYLEQDAVYQTAVAAYHADPVPFDNPPHVGMTTVLPVLLCPSDGRITEPQIAPIQKYLVAFTSYVGVAGTQCRKQDGVLYNDSQVRFADVTDGTSTTLLGGERPPSSDFQYGWWYAGDGQDGSGSAEFILGVLEPNLLPVTSGSPCGPGSYSFAPSNFSDPCGKFHYWSPHSGGANFLFVDGAVHFLSYDAQTVLPALATRAGNEPVMPP